METGLIFNIQKFSIHDGPGIRTNVFLKGCPLRCLWCHNPEGLEAAAEIEYEPIKCIGCGCCAAVCACHTLSAEHGHSFDRTSCIRCGKCVDACPAGALSFAGTRMTVEEVLKKVLSDKPLFFLINSYTTGFQASVLSNMLLKCVSSRHGGSIDAQELCLPVTTGGVLPCGASGRWSAE